MQSVELLLDAATTQRVVAQWDALAQAGLPSQAQHRGATNAPHITIGLAIAIDEEAEVALSALPACLPLTVHLGPPLLFGGKHTVVLARMVLLTRDLLDLHASVTQALRGCPGQVEHLAPSRWVPHVTLARRLKVEALPDAITVLRRHEERGSSETDAPRAETPHAHAAELRRWDSEAKRTWSL
ncbi:2'-5' RNA ligase family protein [soil metagenome]